MDFHNIGMNGKHAQTTPIPHSAILILVSGVWMHDLSDSPSEVDLQKDVGLIWTFPIMDDKD
jgi:hypothetical protein